MIFQPKDTSRDDPSDCTVGASSITGTDSSVAAEWVLLGKPIGLRGYLLTTRAQDMLLP